MSPSRLFPVVLAGLIFGLVWFGLGSGGSGVWGPAGAAAQEAGSRTIQLAQGRRAPGLLEFLFGSRPARRPPRNVGPPGGTVVPQVVDLPPKDPDAKTVVVFGDTFASGLAKGLEKAFARTPTVEIVNRTKLGSGLVRNDFYDWEAAVIEALTTEKTDVAIIMLGSNDRQDIRLPENKREALRSEAWEKRYIERVDSFLKLFAERNVPVYWVGLPIMRTQAYAQDIAFFNEVYQARVQRAGGRFIDMWTRFANEAGNYSAVGPDVNGRTRRLRNNNGIHMTGTGSTKLAFFVEQALRSDLESGRLFAGLPGGGGESGLRKRPTGPIEMEVSLTKPEVPTGAETAALAGEHGVAKAIPEPLDQTPDYKLLVEGESPKPQAGRADDFSWPRGAAGARSGGEAEPRAEEPGAKTSLPETGPPEASPPGANPVQ